MNFVLRTRPEVPLGHRLTGVLGEIQALIALYDQQATSTQRYGAIEAAVVLVGATGLAFLLRLFEAIGKEFQSLRASRGHSNGDRGGTTQAPLEGTREQNSAPNAECDSD